MSLKQAKFTVRHLFFLTTATAVYLALFTILPLAGLELLMLATPFFILLTKRWLPFPNILLTISLVVIVLGLLLPDIQ